MEHPMSPILFHGWNVKQAQALDIHTNSLILPPTLSYDLGIRLPNGATGQPISEITKLNQKHAIIKKALEFDKF